MCNDDDVVMQANLSEAEARALLCLIEIAAKEIRHRIDTRKYEHECQRTIAADVLRHADTIHAGITGVLTRRTMQ